MRCKGCEYLRIPEDEAEAWCTARSKKGRAIAWCGGFPGDLAERKERVKKRLERDVKEPPWCIKRGENIIHVREVKDVQDLVFRKVNGRWCAFLIKETFAGYLDEGKEDEKTITAKITFEI